MLDCQKALKESEGDIEKAVDIIRKSGKSTAAKKSSRVAANGVIVAKAKVDSAILMEINCETDFVAMDKSFLDFTDKVAALALEKDVKDVSLIGDLELDSGTVEEARQKLISQVGENIKIRRMSSISGSNLGVYVHCSRLGAIVSLSGGSSSDSRDIAMHVVSAKPDFLHSSDISQDVIDKERSVQLELAAKSGKPAQIAEKMVNGRMSKFSDEISLTGQNFVKDPNIKVSKFLSQKNASINSFVMLELGFGIEKSQQDFASEVAAQIATSRSNQKS